MKIQISEVDNHGDARGFSFSAPRQALEFIGRIADVHLASVLPGGVRGNHFHIRKRQAIVFLPGSAWSFHWDEGENTTIQRRQFDGKSAVLVLISPGCAQAMRNDGSSPFWLVACSSELYDPGTVIARKVM